MREASDIMIERYGIRPEDIPFYRRDYRIIVEAVACAYTSLICLMIAAYAWVASIISQTADLPLALVIMAAVLAAVGWARSGDLRRDLS